MWNRSLNEAELSNLLALLAFNPQQREHLHRDTQGRGKTASGRRGKEGAKETLWGLTLTHEKIADVPQLTAAFDESDDDSGKE